MPQPRAADAPPENPRIAKLIAVFAGLAVLALVFAAFTARTQPARLLPLPQHVPAVPYAAAQQERATVVLAGGCFWGVQMVFQHTRGVLSAISGYAGGEPSTANYAAVGAGDTAHAEAVLLTYEPAQVSLGELLQIFFSIAHDPTEVNRQGPDTGAQYRSAVFYRTDAERDFVESYIAQLDASAILGAPIATQVVPLTGFFEAEPEHQDYATRNPRAPYITLHDAPKVRNLEQLLPERYRNKPVLVRSSRK